jgi:hypothetical protein
MSNEKNQRFTDEQLRQLWYEIEQEQDEIEISADEIAEIESLPPYQVSPEQDARQRAALETLRQEWLAGTRPLDSLLGQIRVLGFSNREFAQKLRLTPAILLKLDRRQIIEIPRPVIHRLASNLEYSFPAVEQYLTQPPKGMEQMAASSKGKPAETTTETWIEAITNSQMSGEDKDYWLNLNQ